MKKNNGITLVALIITIIILLILAAVTIMSITGDGIISKSRQARVDYERGKQEEEGLLTGYLSKMDEISSGESSGDNGGSTEGGESNSGEDNSSGDNSENNNTPVNTISKSEAFVGYYADVDGNGTVDGVIYADLAIGNIGDGQWEAIWNDSDGNYTINRIDNIKDYYISQTNYSGYFGTKDVLCATGNGNDRFYVMALEDFNPGTKYCWYDAAFENMSDYSSVTSVDFGSGRANTQTMIDKWNSNIYGAQNDDRTYKDVWGQVQKKVNEGWFIPSRAEWSAFAVELVITENNYENKNLNHYYWSSSQGSNRHAWYTRFEGRVCRIWICKQQLLFAFKHDFLICKK